MKTAVLLRSRPLGPRAKTQSTLHIEWQFQRTYTYFGLRLLCRGLYTQFPQSGSFIFKIVAMLQIPWVSPCVSWLGSTKVLGQKLATKVSKSCAIPPCVCGVNLLRWPPISALAYSLLWNKSCIPCASPQKLKLVGEVNHVFDRRGSQFYDFSEQIFKDNFRGKSS